MEDLAVSAGEAGVIRVWNLESGDCLSSFPGHDKSVSSICISPNGKRLVTCSYDQTVKIFTLPDGKCLRVLNGHTDAVHAVCIDPQGAWVVSASSDRTLRVWDVETGECSAILSGHEDWVLSVCVMPDGDHIISGSLDLTIRIWSNGRHRERRKSSSATDAPPSHHANTKVKWTLIDTLTGHKNGVLSLCVTPDGNILLSGSEDRTIRMWKISTGVCLRTFRGHRFAVSSVCMMPDGKRLVSASSDFTIMIWSIWDGECLRTLTGHTDIVRSVKVSLDGRIVSAGMDGTLKVWEDRPRKSVRTFEGHQGRVTSVALTVSSKRRDITHSLYLKALKEGTDVIKRCPLLLVGPGRAGKTSLRRALVGEEFMPKHPSTEVFDLNVVCLKGWEKVDKDEAGLARTVTQAGAHQVVRYLKRQRRRQLAGDKVPPAVKAPATAESAGGNQGGKGGSSGAKAGSQPRSISHRLIGSVSASLKAAKKAPATKKAESAATASQDTKKSAKSRQDGGSEPPCVVSPTSEAEVVMEMVKKTMMQVSDSEVIRKADPGPEPKPSAIRHGGDSASSQSRSSANSSGGGVTVRCYDFAGQEIYYSLHHVFIRAEAVYVLVFDLTKVLKAAKGQKADQDKALRNITFWLNSIESYKRLHPNTDGGPDTILVGTHKDRLPGACSAFQRLFHRKRLPKALSAVNSFLLQHVSNHEFSKRLFRPAGDSGLIFFAVSNDTRKKQDPEIQNVRMAVEEVVRGLHVLHDPKPLRWLRMLEVLTYRGEEDLPVEVLTGTEVKKRLSSEWSNVEEGEIRAMLMYFHDVGELIYFDDLLTRVADDNEMTTGFDRNLVVLEPMWITRMFKAVLTRRDLAGTFQEPLKESEMLVPPQVSMRAGEWREAWEAFLREGRLRRRLIEEYLWKEVPRDVQEKALLLMDRLDLMCPLIPQGKLSAQDFLVPCVPMHYWDEKEVVAAEAVDYDQAQLLGICTLDFLGFLPDALVMRVLLWGVREGIWGPPKLRRLHAELRLLSLLGFPTVVLTIDPLGHRVVIAGIKPAQQQDDHQQRNAATATAKGIWRIIRGFRECALSWAGLEENVITMRLVFSDAMGGTVIESHELCEERLLSEMGITEEAPAEEEKRVGLAQVGALLLTPEDFRQVRFLGHGGCSASVELVECKKLSEALGMGPLFARKFIHPEVFPTYEREVMVAQALEALGPEIQRYYCRVVYHTLGAPSVGPQSRPCWVVLMEYFEGGDLQDYIIKYPERLTESVVMRVATMLNEGLTLLHTKVHRLHLDIKPANILLVLDQADEIEEVKLTDFGVSQVLPFGDQSVSVPCMWEIREPFLAPEQSKRRFACGATDRWQYGVVLLQLICQAPLTTILDTLNINSGLIGASRTNLDAVIRKFTNTTLSETFRLGPLKDLVLDLLQKDPRRRPTNEVIKTRLEAIEKGTAPGPSSRPSLWRLSLSGLSNLSSIGDKTPNLSGEVGINGYRGTLQPPAPPILSFHSTNSASTSNGKGVDRYRGILESVPSLIIQKQSSIVEAEPFDPNMIHADKTTTSNDGL